jgi:predicted MFS family arabinose efflux permease
LFWVLFYYLPAILAEPIAGELGVSVPFFFLAFSAALFVSAAVGPGAGRAIDRRGGRPVLVVAHTLFALALCLLAYASGPVTLVLAWLVMGVAMGSGLYEAAFATLVRLYGPAARNSITGITLIAGFASTIGWPLTAAMEAGLGWRSACLGWAVLHVLIGLPLTAGLPAAYRSGAEREDPPPLAASGSGSAASASSTDASSASAKAESAGAHGLARPPRPARTQDSVPLDPTAHPPQDIRRGIAVRLSIVFAIVWFISTAMATHLPALLQASGMSLSAAVAVGALIGPAQVAGRLLEYGLLRHVHPLLSARLAALTHPLGALLLLLLGPVAAPVFAMLHGAGNGIMTIAKGTLPLALFGPAGYGATLGWMMLPARIAQALSPVIFGVLLTQMEASALWVSAVLATAAAALLLSIRGVALR